MDNQSAILKTKFEFLLKLGFIERPLNSYQTEFSTSNGVILNFFNKSSKRYVEVALFNQGRIEIIVRRVSSFDQLNYQEKNNWVSKYDIGLLTHKQDFKWGNYHTEDCQQTADLIIHDLLLNQEYLCSEKWFNVDMINSTKLLFPRIFSIELTKSESIYNDVKLCLAEILEPYGFVFLRDDSFYPNYLSKSWVKKVVYFNTTRKVELSFGNRDYRDYTEYFHLDLGKRELLMINTDTESETSSILSKIKRALQLSLY